MRKKKYENLQKLRENDLPFQQYEKFVKNASGFCVKIENYRKFGENVVGWNLKL